MCPQVWIVPVYHSTSMSPHERALIELNFFLTTKPPVLVHTHTHTHARAHTYTHSHNTNCTHTHKHTRVGTDPIGPHAYAINQQPLGPGQRQSTWRACYSPRLTYNQQVAQPPRPPYACTCLPLSPAPRPRVKSAIATSIQKSHIKAAAQTFALARGGNQNLDPGDMAHTLTTDPPTVGLNSGAYRDTQSPQRVRRVPEASRQCVKYGLNGFDAHAHSTLPQKAKIEAMQNCLREQRAKRYGLVIVRDSSAEAARFSVVQV
jgi:hypothetical protein